MSAPALPDLIAARASSAGITLLETQIDQLIAYYTLLERWNQRINLTALPLAAREPGTIDRLLIEPLIASTTVAGLMLTWFDFGTGGGSPAVPLKIMKPRWSLTMVEAKERKGAFLREAVSTLALQDARVMTGRIEDLGTSTSAGTADLITIRAVRADLEVLVSARNLLKMHGQLIVFRGTQTEVPQVFGLDLVNERSLHPSSGILSTFHRSNG